MVTASPSAPIPTVSIASPSVSTPMPVTSPDLSTILGTDPSLDATFRAISRHIQQLPQTPVIPVSVTPVIPAVVPACQIPESINPVLPQPIQPIQPVISIIDLSSSSDIEMQESSPEIDRIIPSIHVLDSSSSISPDITTRRTQPDSPISSGNSFMEDLYESEKLTSVIATDEPPAADENATVSTSVMSFLGFLPPIRMRINLDVENATASSSSK